MSTKLPAVIPFNDPVTVCAKCRTAACALQRIRCAAAKRGPLGLEKVPLAAVKAAAKENPGYWKARHPRRDDHLPVDVEDLEELVRWTRERAECTRPVLAFYLQYELGIDRDQVAEAIAKEWPEVSGTK